MKRWMLHGNISRKGYGNALIGRYGGCFEERYKVVYDDRAYHAKGLDSPAGRCQLSECVTAQFLQKLKFLFSV